MSSASKRPAPRIEPRGLSRFDAAAYVGISATTFEKLVGDGRMPPPKRINRRMVWDRRSLDEAFEALPETSELNPWDSMPDDQKAAP